MGLFGAKGIYGFGCMRLPMNDGAIDLDETNRMIDAYLDAGFNYFDTAHGYLDGKSERALHDTLVARYPRDRYVLVNKLTNAHWQTGADIRPLLEAELEACGVEYFDALLMHAQNEQFYERYMKEHAYKIGLEFVHEGKAKHFGISFHDKATVLERILDEHPEIEMVQLQFNYMDFDDESIEARKCYEACESRGIPVVVMEPLRGGCLIDLPPRAIDAIAALPGNVTPAQLALRWCTQFPGVKMILSGVSDLAQMEDNIRTLSDPAPLSPAEERIIDEVRSIYRSMDLIDCTACRYCTSSCPENIDIPDLFSVMNTHTMYQNWNSNWYYMVYTQNGGTAGDCIQCGVCEEQCPQNLPIPKLLEKVSAQFDE